MSPRKASSKPNNFSRPGPSSNTTGLVTPQSSPGPAGGSTRPPLLPETPEEKNFLERGKVVIQGKIDAAVEGSGSNKIAMVAGAIATALNEVFMPTALWELIPAGKVAKIAEKGVELAARTRRASKGAGKAAKADEEVRQTGGGGNGGHVKGGGKRRPGRRCELLPYKDLLCDEGQEAHHVVPDWMLRLGKRGGAEQIPDMPSLAEGPAICLEKGSGKEHNAAHKHTDRPAARLGRSGKAGGTPGTIKLGQGKAISARAIEKATGGPSRGGCSRQDIKQQLDQQFKAHDDALIRAEKDARRVTKAIRSAVNREVGDL